MIKHKNILILNIFIIHHNYESISYQHNERNKDSLKWSYYQEIGKNFTPETEVTNGELLKYIDS